MANIETERGIKERVRFYDTAGLDGQTKEVPRHLLQAADGFVIVYSVEDRASFLLAESIRKEIRNIGEKKDQVVLVLGTKVDLAESRQVDSTQAADWAAAEKVRKIRIGTSRFLY